MTTTFHIRPALAQLSRYRTGGVAVLRRTTPESAPGPLVQLAQNEGSYGPLPSAQQAVRAAIAAGNRYPEGDYSTLRRAIAAHHGIPEERVFVAGGTTAIMHYLSLCLLEPGDEAVFGRPSFLAYHLETLKMGATPVGVPLTAEGSFDTDAILRAITPRTKIAYLANPNNPSGGLLTRAEVSDFLDRLPAHVVPVLDEAYFEYVDDPDYPDGIHEFAASATGRHAHRLVVLRTFSKIYGLAGLRVGYAVMPPDLVQAAMSAQVPFEVNTLGLAAAEASLAAPAHEIAHRRHETITHRKLLADALTGLGIPYLPSAGNFLQARVGNADTVAAELEHHGVLVRSLTTWGAPDSVRITIGTRPELDHLIAALPRTSFTRTTGRR
ncbi:aminotransferase class I/II-fold pyridoxal phosphate-dependent enzyme [Streptomyces piniterrae]|uniref:Aminotransferase class I/II-fold pyridoxal phosphate-dependent enzyme n=1 Tax=Streptomyces piniterrae TaxID=2571125 RepID=A0A4U0NJJ6_9ACTN|nr:aminotransferase class I/II-fold pyridoxal phosphate-dependent enzyme [Streptomyces piniterrae]TJZ54253.1 aminotransferase class I/II-fold pyridoxal phosphate-dependent enzyme [Streptomyces piniterrae]